MRTRLSISVSVLAAAAALAAQGSQTPREPQATFRTGANYVRVDMYAMLDGQPIHDIRREEIEVLEDGVPQAIEDFEHVLVRPPGTQETAAREPDGLRASREAAADPRARVFVIFLDTYHTQLEGSANVRRPLVRFLERVLGPDDLVALMTPEMGASDISLGRKTTVIANVLSEEWWGRRARVADEDPKEILYKACGAQMNLSGAVVAETIARRREKLTLDAFEDLMTHLGGLRDERKAVVVVTEGWMLFRPNPALAKPNPQVGPAQPPVGRPPVTPPSERTGAGVLDQSTAIECEADRNALANVDHDARLREITDDANRGNVTFYPVHARGLVVFDAPIGPDPPPPLAVDAANLRTRIESMRALAVDTDGEALVNTNNLEGGLKRIADDLSSYYLLGYYSTNNKLDGRFRSITVRVKRPGVRVRARRGYRGRTAEELVSRASAGVDPARDAVASALNRVAGLNARAAFRVRPSVWARADGSSSAGAVWLVGELDYRTRKELAWTAGAEAQITLVGVDGTQLLNTTVAVPAAAASFAIQLPETGALAPGDYAVNVRLRPESGSDLALTDTVRVTVPDRAAPVGEAVIWRRGPSTGPQHLRTADPRFQRNERLRLEFATAAEGTATARVLDRAGKAIQMPVQVSSRTDNASGIRWIVADATLAPLAPGDYAIELKLGDVTQVTGFRLVP
jgi:VWFA-related protein